MRAAYKRLLPYALILGVLPSTARAQATAAGERFGLWVIGPTAQARGWASEWIEAAVRDQPQRPAGEIIGWQTLLPMLLDSDPEPLGTPPSEASSFAGPNASPAGMPAWPWDMTQRVALEDMVGALRQGRLTMLVQVLVSAIPPNVGSRDSVWILEAEAIAPWSDRGGAGQRVVLATSRRESSASLRAASSALGLKLAAVWSELMAERSARAR